MPSKTIQSDVKIIDDVAMSELYHDTGDTASFVPGELVSGEVIFVSKNKILVDIDKMLTGAIFGQELVDSTKTASGIEVGDKVDAMIIGLEDDEGNLQLSLKKASQIKTWSNFNKAFDEGESLEVNIVEANKGGLLVDVDGIRGFIPVSQLSPENYPRVNGADSSKILTKLKALIGQRLTVKILSIDRTEGRLIFSERAAQSKERMAVISELKVGEIIKGKVSGVVNFGIFVNYKGVEGLVHISEITWGHVDDSNKFAKVGDELDVLVIGVEGEKISFSMKRLTEDPWLEAVSKYTVGDIVKAPVSRVTPFGVFLKVDKEIDGLIHVSELVEPYNDDPVNTIEIGQEIEVRIISIDADSHRLGLSMKEPSEETDDADDESEEAEPQGKDGDATATGEESGEAGSQKVASDTTGIKDEVIPEDKKTGDEKTEPKAEDDNAKK